MPKAAASKAHLRGDGVEDAQLTKMLDDEHDFPQPTGGRGDRFGSGLDDHRRISDTGHVYLLVGKDLYPSLKGGTFYACPLQTISRCAIRGKRTTATPSVCRSPGTSPSRRAAMSKVKAGLKVSNGLTRAASAFFSATVESSVAAQFSRIDASSARTKSPST